MTIGASAAGSSGAVMLNAIGAAFLLAAVVGSGIMAERLAGGNVAIALLANTTRDRRRAGRADPDLRPDLRRALQPGGDARRRVAGRPAVARCARLRRARRSPAPSPACAAAHLMFEEPRVLRRRTHARSGPAQLFSEFVATFGLLAVIWGCAAAPRSAPPVRGRRLHHGGLLVHRIDLVREPGRHAGARAATDTFAGIRPADVPGFVVAQLLGGPRRPRCSAGSSSRCSRERPVVISARELA